MSFFLYYSFTSCLASVVDMFAGFENAIQLFYNQETVFETKKCKKDVATLLQNVKLDRTLLPVGGEMFFCD